MDAADEKPGEAEGSHMEGVLTGRRTRRPSKPIPAPVTPVRLPCGHSSGARKATHLLGAALSMVPMESPGSSQCRGKGDADHVEEPQSTLPEVVGIE